MSEVVKEIEDRMWSVSFNLTSESVAFHFIQLGISGGKYNEFPTGPPLQQLIFWFKCRTLILKKSAINKIV